MSVVQIKEQLTSLERVGLALQRKETDRIPVAPLFCGASHRVLGITYDSGQQMLSWQPKVCWLLRKSSGLMLLSPL